MSLNHLNFLRKSISGSKRFVLTRLLGMDVHPSAQMSLSAKLDMTFPKGVHIGARSYIAFDARILTHDRTRGLYLHTRIGENCFIGGRSLILPGVTVGDGSIVGAGSVVTKNVPPHSIVAGNPAVVIRSDVEVGPYGRLKIADDNERRLRETDASVGALPSKAFVKAERERDLAGASSSNEFNSGEPSA